MKMRNIRFNFSDEYAYCMVFTKSDIRNLIKGGISLSWDYNKIFDKLGDHIWELVYESNIVEEIIKDLKSKDELVEKRN